MSDDIKHKARERTRRLGEERIPKILFRLSLPAIVAMMTTAIYNVVDALFIGRLGTSAIGAISVAFPIFSIIGAIGLAFGMGAASYISRMLGADNHEEAERAAATSFFSVLFLGSVFIVVGLAFIQGLLASFGATDTIMPYAIDYTRVLIIGAPLTMLNMTLNNMVRAEGNARFSMMAMMTGALLNILLDPLFIFVFNMGITGAAVATVLAQGASFTLLVSSYLRGKNHVHISIRMFTPSVRMYLEILKIGAPAFIRNFLSGFTMALINTAARGYGDAAVASVGVTFRLLMFCMFPLFGFGQGFQPVAGFNYGAGKIDRVIRAVKVSLLTTSGYSTFIAAVGLLFAPAVISAFSSDPRVLDIGSRALRYIMVLFPFFGFQVSVMVLFQALGKGLPAAFLSLARQGIFLIPAVLLLPGWFGLTGILLSQPAADACSIVVTAVLGVRVFRFLRRSRDHYQNADGPRR